MVTVAQLKRDLEEIKAAAGKKAQVMPWEIPGLYAYRNAKAHQVIVSSINRRLGRDPIPLPFDPSDYGRDLAYYEAWDVKAFDYYRDRPISQAEEEKLNRALTERILNQLHASEAPTLTN